VRCTRRSHPRPTHRPTHPPAHPPQVKTFYESFSFLDDLAWGAAWLALATADPSVAEEARLYWLRHISDEGGGEGRRFDYNNLQQGVGFLMALLYPAKRDQYMQPARDVMALWLNQRSNITFTEKVGWFMRGGGGPGGSAALSL